MKTWTSPEGDYLTPGGDTSSVNAGDSVHVEGQVRGDINAGGSVHCG